MATTAPTDNGSIQGDTWHDYVNNAADNSYTLAAAALSYANAIAAI